MSDAYQNFIPIMIQFDNTMALYIGLCVVGCYYATRLWRRSERFRAVAALAGRVAVPLYVAPLNPLLALLSMPSGFVTLPKRLPRPMLLIGLLALMLRVPHMTEDFWFDESFSAVMARLDLSQFFAATAQDIHPPLHNLLLHFWAQFVGDSTLLLRVPALGFGLLSIYLMYHVAKALKLNKRTSQIAALIVSLMPSAIYYGVELRAYALMSCLVMGVLLSILKNRPRWFVLLCPLMFLNHHYGLIYSAVMGVAAFAYWKNRRWFRAGAVVASAMLLWLPNVMAQSSTVTDGFWIYNSPAKLLTAFVDMTVKATTEDDYILLIIPTATVILLSLYHSLNWFRNRTAILWGAVTIGVPITAMILSYLYVPLFVARYLYPSVVLLAIPIAIAVDKSNLLARSALALAIVGVAVGFISPRPPYRTLVQQHCPNAQAFYHINMESSFILSSAFPDATHRIYPNASDQGAALTGEDIPVFGFRSGDITEFVGQRVCVMEISNLLTLPYEQVLIASLKAAYSYTENSFRDSGSNFTFYEFEVE